MPVVLTALSGLFGFLGKAVGGLFNFKAEQATTIQDSLDLLSTIDDNASKSTVALAASISAILTQGSFLERNWRAVLMSACVAILLSFYFGYVPPHFNDPLTPMMQNIIDLIKIGLGGYIVKGGVVDVVKMFNISSILKTFISKKIV